MNLTVTTNNPTIMQYHLYKNTFDNSYVIVADILKDLFERTLTNLGCAPLIIASDYQISDLQIKAVEFGIKADVIDNLQYNN
jgi:hypothetical protein